MKGREIVWEWIAEMEARRADPSQVVCGCDHHLAYGIQFIDASATVRCTVCGVPWADPNRCDFEVDGARCVREARHDGRCVAS